MPRRPSLAPLVAVVLAAVLLPAAYMGIYYAMLKGGVRSKDSYGVLIIVPDYRVGGKVVSRLLVPAHEIDRFFRPVYWNPVSWVVQGRRQSVTWCYNAMW